jgi:hypothetical protein
LKENHTGMIEHAIAELPVSGKAGVVYKHPISFAKPRSFCRFDAPCLSVRRDEFY